MSTQTFLSTVYPSTLPTAALIRVTTTGMAHVVAHQLARLWPEARNVPMTPASLAMVLDVVTEKQRP